MIRLLDLHLVETGHWLVLRTSAPNVQGHAKGLKKEKYISKPRVGCYAEPCIISFANRAAKIEKTTMPSPPYAFRNICLLALNRNRVLLLSLVEVCG